MSTVIEEPMSETQDTMTRGLIAQSVAAIEALNLAIRNSGQRRFEYEMELQSLREQMSKPELSVDEVSAFQARESALEQSIRNTRAEDQRLEEEKRRAVERRDQLIFEHRHQRRTVYELQEAIEQSHIAEAHALSEAQRAVRDRASAVKGLEYANARLVELGETLPEVEEYLRRKD